MAFDLASAKENSVWQLLGGQHWRFLHLGYSSKNIAVGETNDGSFCLFANGRYRMDDQAHPCDILAGIMPSPS